MLNDVSNSACAAAVGMELLRKAAEKINPIALPSGGIVVLPPPKVGVAQMPTGEMVLNREQAADFNAHRQHILTDREMYERAREWYR